MKKLLLILLLLITHHWNAKSIADVNFYLVDNLNIEELTEPDKQLLDSCLHLYHNSKKDIERISLLNVICENMVKGPWIRYQFFQLEMLKEALKSESKRSEIIEMKGYLASALNNVGVFYMDDVEPERSLIYFDKSLKIAKELGDRIRIAETMVNMARLSDLMGDSKEAIQGYYVGLRTFWELGNIDRVDWVLANVGEIYFDLGLFDKAFRIGQMQLRTSSKLNNKKGIADALNILGAIYYTQGDFSESLDYHLRSLEIHKELNDKTNMAVLYTNIGYGYFKNRELAKSLEYYRKGLKISEEINFKKGVARSLGGFGLIRQFQGDYKGALEYYYKRLKLSREENLKLGILESSHNIAVIYFYQGKLDSSYTHALNSLKLAQEMGSPMNIFGPAKLLSRIYEKQGQMEKAIRMYELFEQMKDSADSKDVQRKMNLLEYKSEMEKKEQQIILLSREKELKSLKFKFSLLAYVCLLSILFVVGWLWFRSRKKSYEDELNTLRRLNTEISQKKLTKEVTSIPVTFGGKIKLIQLKEVSFFKANRNYVILNTKEGKAYVIDYTMSKLEESLPEEFMRVHRSFVINRNCIAQIKKTYKGKVLFTMDDELTTKIPSSITYAEQVKGIIEDLKLG